MQRIVGKKFHCISRAVDMLCLFLGEDYVITSHRGKRIDVAEYSLHVQTLWNVREDDIVLLTAENIYEPYCENAPADWQYDLIERPDEISSVFDVKAKKLNAKMQNTVVVECALSAQDNLMITFSNGVIFELVMPAAGDEEAWRLIDYKNDVHIVCSQDGNITAEA